MQLPVLNEWNPKLGIKDVLTSVQKLLQQCNLDNALNAHIAKQYASDRKLHDTLAREWTLRFAK